jgi:hypothetical protein
MNVLPQFPAIMKMRASSHSETLVSPCHTTNRHLREELNTFSLYLCYSIILSFQPRLAVPIGLYPSYFPAVDTQNHPHVGHNFRSHFPVSFCRSNLHSEYFIYSRFPAKFLLSGNLFPASLRRHRMSDKFNFGARGRVNSAMWVFISYLPQIFQSRLLQ